MGGSPPEDPPPRLPAVHRVLSAEQIKSLVQLWRREPVVNVIRAVLAAERQTVELESPTPSTGDVADEVVRRVQGWRTSPGPVINATGVILHTNLGRAPLSDDARRAVATVAGYCDLEYDLSSGARGSRQGSVEHLLLPLTGAEAAHVAVNNGAAVLLALAALAKGREVIVSRGQAVEIGGGFRIPVILRESGARLIEVGTTNRTRLSDYEEAISSRTAAILHVHTSNFRVVGFTDSPSLGELAKLAHAAGICLVDDNGSGSLLDTARFGLAHEPTPIESLEAGSDLVAFSGDKLLGGPQSGILLGRDDLIRRIARHPLARVTRPDKLALAALSATLLAYLRGDAERVIPVWAMILQTGDEIRARAESWKELALGRGLNVDLLPGESTVGGGSLPTAVLPTTLIALPPFIHASDLRAGSLPVLARTQGKRVLLDLRTVAADEAGRLLEAVLDVGAAGRGRPPA